MTQNYLCISIPEELQKFTKVVSELDSMNQEENRSNDFGVKLIKDEEGNLKGTAYYSATGELIKKVYYDGSSVSQIKHYRNNVLYSQEKFDKGKIIKKILYDLKGAKISTIEYQYNRADQIVNIRKITKDLRYSVEYGYDELKRVNSRVIRANGEIVNEQWYRYDILDRIIEYKDLNQCINIHKINQNNELISYTITDVLRNRIVINNKFICSDYIGTEIDLNDHKTTVKDKSYVNNVMLKKPYTSEDDLDFVLSNITKAKKIDSMPNFGTRRKTEEKNNDIADYIILNKKESEERPPISADKIRTLKFN